MEQLHHTQSLPMAIPLISISLILATLSFLSTDATNPDPLPLTSFSFPTFIKNHTSNPEIALSGDAEIIDSAIITTTGQIMPMKPIQFLGTNPGFSTNFSFSISPSGALVFSLSRNNDLLLSVKYVSSRGGVDHIEVNIRGEISIRSTNLTIIKEKLYSWIDYDGESNRLEVKLSNFSYPRPREALISHEIDLKGMLWREAMFVFISSSSENSTQASIIYSWDFTIRHGAPYRMHSEPLDPHQFLIKPRERHHVPLRRVHFRRILMAFIFTATCGLLMAFVIVFMLSMMFARRPVAPMEYPEQPMECLDEKIVFVGEKVVDSTAK